MLLAIVLPLFGAGVARADDEFTTGFPHFLFEQSWTVPEGVTAATMELTGAAGGDFGGQGAEGGVIRATLTGLSPGTSFAVCLGGDGKQAISAFVPGGGVNGGGNAPLGGFGGGGATDIRLSGNCLDGADMRLLVAGGGGGQGAFSSDGRPGGHGGSPGVSATGGASYSDEFFTHVIGGGGGGAASASANGSGGPGGTAGNTDAVPDVHNGSAGGAGETVAAGRPVGGAGGLSASGGADPADNKGLYRGGAGGGGGGGYFAGGGGGGGGFYDGGGFLNQVPAGATGGGGGGAGSNCLGLGSMTCAGAATSIASTNQQPRPPSLSVNGDGAVLIWYPNVSIDSPAADASFEQDAFASASFACSVETGPPLRDTDPCVGVVTKPDGSTVSVSSGDALPTDTVGSHTLTVTAVDARGGTRQLTRSYSVVPATPPANTELPAISGAPVVGETLEATQGSWNGTAPIDVQLSLADLP